MENSDRVIGEGVGKGSMMVCVFLGGDFWGYYVYEDLLI